MHKIEIYLLTVIGILCCMIAVKEANAPEPITEIKFTEMYCPECGAPLEFELEICEED